MASETKTIKRAAKALRCLQDEQAKAVRRAGRLRRKLEKAGCQMQALEAEMARLERQVHALRNPGGQPITQVANGLRPATVIIIIPTVARLPGKPVARNVRLLKDRCSSRRRWQSPPNR